MTQWMIPPDSVEGIRITLQRIASEILGTEAIVRTRVPNPRPAEFYRLIRTGGIMPVPVIDRPQLTLEAWASSEARAARMQQVGRGILHGLRETDDGLTVYGCSEIAGPADLPDPLSGQFRSTGTYLVSVRVKATTTA